MFIDTMEKYCFKNHCQLKNLQNGSSSCKLNNSFLILVPACMVYIVIFVYLHNFPYFLFFYHLNQILIKAKRCSVSHKSIIVIKCQPLKRTFSVQLNTPH